MQVKFSGIRLAHDFVSSDGGAEHQAILCKETGRIAHRSADSEIAVPRAPKPDKRVAVSMLIGTRRRRFCEHASGLKGGPACVQSAPVLVESAAFAGYAGAMAEDAPDNLILRMLRDVDRKLDRLIDDVRDLQSRVTSLEAQMALTNSPLDRMDRRLGRIERRLELTEARA